MARFGLENIDRDFFWELVDEGYGEWRGIEDAYLYMMSKKLSKDTDINFRVENGYLYNDEIGFKIPTSTITTYDNLLKQIENFLKENSPFPRTPFPFKELQKIRFLRSFFSEG